VSYASLDWARLLYFRIISNLYIDVARQGTWRPGVHDVRV
jgi:hypothetical protein